MYICKCYLILLLEIHEGYGHLLLVLQIVCLYALEALRFLLVLAGVLLSDLQDLAVVFRFKLIDDFLVFVLLLDG